MKTRSARWLTSRVIKQRNLKMLLKQKTTKYQV